MAFIYALPLESMKGVVAIGEASAGALFGLRGGNFFSAIMSVGLLSCVSAMVIAGPRVYFAMAVDRLLFPHGGANPPSMGNADVCHHLSIVGSRPDDFDRDV